MSNLTPARRSPFGALSTDRAAGKQFATIQAGAFLERAEDEALRNLVVAKLADIGIATGTHWRRATRSSTTSRVASRTTSSALRRLLVWAKRESVR